MGTPRELTAGRTFDRPKGTARYVNRRLVAGGAGLIGGGLMIWLAGLTICMIALASGCRRYVADRGEPPGETVHRRWQQAKKAASDGYAGWQNYV